MQERQFYPMITNTLSHLLRLVDPVDMADIVEIICAFPNHQLDGDTAAKPIVYAVLDELNRQYGRWNKGGNNGTR